MILVGGPTASGKSVLAVEIARAVGGEVVSADAMAIWRGFDIGTAKPPPEEMRGVPHHMIDIADPRGVYTVAEYRRDALAVIAAIETRGRVPVVCGGTGLYLRALLRPLSFGSAPGDPAMRARWAAYGDEHGPEALHRELARRDPVSAARLHPNDVRRVVRALEIVESTGKPVERGEEAEDAQGDALFLAVTRDRAGLVARINRRVDAMIRRGLVNEVRSLRASIPDDAQAMQGLGYKEIAAHLRGECSLLEAIERMRIGTRQYAKRQMTWLRRESGVTWTDLDRTPPEDIVASAAAWLSEPDRRSPRP